MTTSALEGRLEEALAFDAPYVIDRLVRDRVAVTPMVAEQLFTEAKKYLVLCAATPDKSFGMFLAMVDRLSTLSSSSRSNTRSSVIAISATTSTMRPRRTETP
ncbi:hypothetical protein [Mycolicibacterium celeriflavum]|uniref:hypothetical protein n=1 Tax=Mycolicibacterium celeriflavum TaxID=1249101 RepID=UPI003CEC65D1